VAWFLLRLSRKITSHFGPLFSTKSCLSSKDKGGRWKRSKQQDQSEAGSTL
jgi:hypothetical protein